MINLTLFYFLSIFPFFYLFWFLFSLFFILDLGKGCNVTSHVIVTQVTKYNESVTLVIEWSYISQSQII